LLAPCPSSTDIVRTIPKGSRFTAAGSIRGCGDFINDYEGVAGHEYFRGDLSLMYFATLDAGSGRLTRPELVPTQMKRFQVRRAIGEDASWLCAVLQRESAAFGVRFRVRPNGRIDAAWDAQ
jgi:poly-gamma-glutamate capsule biosynthesis protein CapA/YwtB (metallophosphatase superfamily)